MFKPETDLIDPLDYLILGDLPLAGTLVFDLYPDGRTAKHLSEDLLKGALKPQRVGRRMATLGKAGLVIQASGLGTHAGQIYQATAEGKKYYRQWKNRKVDAEKAGASDGGE